MQNFLPIFITGFVASFAQIVAIGPQNIFVLKSGIANRNTIMVPLLCILCDVLFITLSVFGIASFMIQNPIIMKIFHLTGACFLFNFSFHSIKSSFKNKKLEMKDQIIEESTKSVAMAVLAVSFLNPATWMDTLVVIGPLSSEYPEMSDRVCFYIGSVLASIVWFFLLSFAARIAAPIFSNPKSWKILDLLIGILMFCLAIKLLVWIIKI